MKIDRAPIDPRRVAEAKRLYMEAEEAAKNAVIGVAHAVRAAHRCGAVLLMIRARYPETRGGDRTGQSRATGAKRTHVQSFLTWERFVEEVLGFHPRTCRRYMRLAEVPLDDFRHVKTIRQAYLLSGVLPPPAPREPAREKVRRPRHLQHLAKLGRYFEAMVSSAPPEKWDPAVRRALKEQMRPLVELYRRLGGKAEGPR